MRQTRPPSGHRHRVEGADDAIGVILLARKAKFLHTIEVGGLEGAAVAVHGVDDTGNVVAEIPHQIRHGHGILRAE